MGLCLAEIWASLGCECPASASVSARAPLRGSWLGGAQRGSRAPWGRKSGRSESTPQLLARRFLHSQQLIVAKKFCFVLNTHPLVAAAGAAPSQSQLLASDLAGNVRRTSPVGFQHE